MPIKSAVFTELAFTQLDGIVAKLGEPAYRAKQLRQWVFKKLAVSFDEMTDLPLVLRQRLGEEMQLHSLKPLEIVTGQDSTTKALFELADGNTVESALMFYEGEGRGVGRRTVCVSTQAGCAFGCPFCATGQQGFERNLTPGEITDQALYFARYLRDKESGNKSTEERKSGHISNIVFMGMGEPLANYDNLWQAIEMLNSPEGFGLGARNLVISTCGLAPEIKRLAQEKLQVGLAISLHAADNELRDKLVPINRRYPLEQLIPACMEYSRLTGRRLSFEYILFKGVNDSLTQARALAGLVKGIKCHVNLIPANVTASPSFRPPSRAAVLAFENELKQQHINVTLRERRGQDIAAGCGQLRGRVIKDTVGKSGKSIKTGKTKNVA